MNRNDVSMQLYTTRKFQPYEQIFKFLSESGIKNFELFDLDKIDLDNFKSMMDENDISKYENINNLMYDQEVVFGIRPENINIEKNENSILCKVELVEPMGADTLVWTSVEGNPISIRLEGSSNFNLNDEINISFDINKSSIFDSKTEERI